MKIKIEVTQKDIENGVPSSCGRCPVAIAAKRYLGREFEARVGTSIITFGSNSTMDSDSYDLPKKVQKFIDKFDDYEKVKPVSFALNVKSRYIKKSVRK